MGKYLLENVHEQFPAARLGIVVGSRGAMIRDLFAAYPWLEVIEANRRSSRSLFYLFKNFYGSDVAVTQYAGKRGGAFSLPSKIIARLLAKRGGFVGFTDTSRWNDILYDNLVPVRSDISVAEHDRNALKAAGMAVPIPFPTLRFVEDADILRRFKLEEEKFIIVHLFSGAKGRGLYPDKKRELLGALAEKFPNVRLVMSGGAEDREEALSAAAGLPVDVIAGKATLQELMNLIAKGRSVVSLDTGVAHVTAQLGKPIVVMRACLGRGWWLPDQYGSDVPIIVCSHDVSCAAGHAYKDYPACLNGISAREVVEAAARTVRSRVVRGAVV